MKQIDWQKAEAKRENDFISHKNRKRKELHKCQIEDCDNPATGNLIMADKETKFDVCVGCCAEFTELSDCDECQGKMKAPYEWNERIICIHCYSKKQELK